MSHRLSPYARLQRVACGVAGDRSPNLQPAYAPDTADLRWLKRSADSPQKAEPPPPRAAHSLTPLPPPPAQRATPGGAGALRAAGAPAKADRAGMDPAGSGAPAPRQQRRAAVAARAFLVDLTKDEGKEEEEPPEEDRVVKRPRAAGPGGAHASAGASAGPGPSGQAPGRPKKKSKGGEADDGARRVDEHGNGVSYRSKPSQDVLARISRAMPGAGLACSGGVPAGVATWPPDGVQYACTGPCARRVLLLATLCVPGLPPAPAAMPHSWLAVLASDTAYGCIQGLAMPEPALILALAIAPPTTSPTPPPLPPFAGVGGHRLYLIQRGDVVPAGGSPQGPSQDFTVLGATGNGQ